MCSSLMLLMNWILSCRISDRMAAYYSLALAIYSWTHPTSRCITSIPFVHFGFCLGLAGIGDISPTSASRSCFSELSSLSVRDFSVSVMTLNRSKNILKPFSSSVVCARVIGGLIMGGFRSRLDFLELVFDSAGYSIWVLDDLWLLSSSFPESFRWVELISVFCFDGQCPIAFHSPFSYILIQ